MSGAITYVRWGNPHSEVRLKIDDTWLPADLTQRALPAGGDETTGRASPSSV